MPFTQPTATMNRRDALKSLLLGSALLACAREARDAGDAALMESIADTLLPDTPGSPGARAAGAGAAIQLLLADGYDEAARKNLTAGLAELRDRHAGLAARPAAERERILREVAAEAKRAGDAHWFHLARELSVRAYFTSEAGMTKALRWVQTPGRWDGCTPLQAGQRAWA